MRLDIHSHHCHECEDPEVTVLREIASFLERIAVALERAFPRVPARIQLHIGAPTEED